MRHGHAFSGMVLALALCAALLSSHVAASPHPRGAPALMWGDLQPGSYSVGYRVLYERDKTRQWLNSSSAAASAASPDPGRPIRISLWYPAVPTPDAKPMRYGDYFHFDGPPDFKSLDDALQHNDRASWMSDLAENSPKAAAIFAKLLATPVAAFSNAPAARGPFPVVLYAPGLGSRADSNVELAEFLASHGYAVAIVPQLGPSLEDLANGSSPAEITLHVQDMDFAENVLHQQRSLDTTNVGVIGHSAGGVAALDFAMKHPEAKAVVGLDGSYGMVEGERVFTRVPGYAPGQITASILDLRRADGVQGAHLDPTALDQARSADRYLVKYPRVFHGDFTEWAPVAWNLSVPLPPNSDGRTRRTGFEGNQNAYRAVLLFLDAKLRGRRRLLSQLPQLIESFPGATFAHDTPALTPQ